MKQTLIVCTIVSCAAMVGASFALAQSPQGEPPSRAQIEEGKKRKQAEQKLALTLETRGQLLNELYATLRQTKDKPAATPVIAAIKEVWSFSGSPTIDLLLDRAAAAIEVKDTPVAMKLIDTAMELQDDFPRAYLMRAMAHVVQGDSRRAIDDLRRTISLDPKNFLPYGMLADEYLKQKMFKESRDAIETLLKLCPAAKELYPESDATNRSLNEQGI